MARPSFPFAPWPAVFFAVIAGSVALFIGSFSGGHDWGSDFAAYLMQARSIVEHDPLRFIEENRFTMERSTRAMGPVAYPWGFPLLLAPVHALTGLDLTALKLVGVASYALFLTTLVLGLRSVHTRPALLLVVALFAFNPEIIAFGDQILSDLPFLLFSTLSVLWIWRTVAQGRVILGPVTDQLLGGMFIACAILLRSNGALLIPVLLLSQWVGYRRRAPRTPPDRAREIRRLAVPYAALAVLLLLVRLVLPEGGGTYLDFLRPLSPQELFESIEYNLSLPKVFFASVPLYLLSLPFVLLGIRRRWRDDYGILLYCGLTLALYVLWPYRQGLRFLYPILPFYVSYLVTGLWCAASSRLRFLGWMAIALFALEPVRFLYMDVVRVERNLAAGRPVPDGPFSADSTELFQFLRDHTAPQDVIVFRKPRALRLLVPRPAIRALNVDDARLGRYLVLDLRNRDKQPDLVEVERLVNTGLAVPCFRNSQFVVYRLGQS